MTPLERFNELEETIRYWRDRIEFYRDAEYLKPEKIIYELQRIEAQVKFIRRLVASSERPRMPWNEIKPGAGFTDEGKN